MAELLHHDLDLLTSAVRLYSGDQYHVNRNDPAWNGLAQTLRVNQLTALEYCYWLVFVRSQCMQTDMPGVNPGILCMRNLVCSPKTVNECLVWKRHNDDTMKHLVQSQIDRFNSYVELDYNLLDVLLNPAEPFGAAFRCEKALEHLSQDDADKVCTKYQEMAMLFLAGQPGYRTYVPVTTEWVKKCLSQRGITY